MVAAATQAVGQPAGQALRSVSQPQTAVGRRRLLEEEQCVARQCGGGRFGGAAENRHEMMMPRTNDRPTDRDRRAGDRPVRPHRTSCDL